MRRLCYKTTDPAKNGVNDDVLKICFCTTYQQFNNSEPEPFHLKSTIMPGYFLNVLNIHFRQ